MIQNRASSMPVHLKEIDPCLESMYALHQEWLDQGVFGNPF
jgi:hypothetical protein